MPEPTPRPRRYSERAGIRPILRFEPQFRSLDSETRRLLWNAIYEGINSSPAFTDHRVSEEALARLDVEFYRGNIETDPSISKQRALAHFRDDVLLAEFEDTFDVLEAWYDIITRAANPFRWEPEFVDSHTASKYEAAINRVFDSQHVEHRMRGGYIIDIGNSAEGDAITAVLETGGPFGSAREHFERAMRHLSNPTDSIPLDAMREAIHAAESAGRVVAGSKAKTLSEAVREIERLRPDTHPALTRGWATLYGWTSDENGFRHGGVELTDPSPALARWLVVCVAAFIRYLEAEFPPAEQGSREG